MIKFLRDLFFADFWLKLFSLALAVLIWLTVSFAVEKEIKVRTFSKLPVSVMSTAEDVRHLRVRPSEVEVTVQGEGSLVRGLRPSDIRAMVDVTGIEGSHALKKRIDVSIMAGISLIRVEPPEVEIIFPAWK